MPILFNPDGPEASARIQALENRVAELEGFETALGAMDAALQEVMDWVENWSPNFTEDEEWPETESLVKAAFALRRALADRPTQDGK